MPNPTRKRPPVKLTKIAPDLGQQIISAIGTLSNVRATEELEQRIITLEARAI